MFIVFSPARSMYMEPLKDMDIPLKAPFIKEAEFIVSRIQFFSASELCGVVKGRSKHRRIELYLLQGFLFFDGFQAGFIRL